MTHGFCHKSQLFDRSKRLLEDIGPITLDGGGIPKSVRGTLQRKIDDVACRGSGVDCYVDAAEGEAHRTRVISDGIDVRMSHHLVHVDPDTVDIMHEFIKGVLEDSRVSLVCGGSDRCLEFIERCCDA